MGRLSREAAEALGIHVPMRAPNLSQFTQHTSASAADAGAMSQKRGNEYEGLLEYTHHCWASKGLASIEKRPVDHAPAPKRIRDPQEKFACGLIRILTKRSGFDYQGVVAGGRAIAVEAKATGTRRSSIKIGDRGIREHQLKDLSDKYRRFDMIVTIVWNNGGERYFLPPKAVVSAWEAWRTQTRKSIPIRMFERYQTEGGLECYLNPLLESMEGTNHE